MGLFDKIKNAAQNAAEGVKESYAEAEAMDIMELCDMLKEIGKLDPKLMGYRSAFRTKCEQLNNEQLEELYLYIKKTSSLLKEHPGKDPVEDILVRRNVYHRDEEGHVSKNVGFHLFKK